jgi:hypothetical protein
MEAFPATSAEIQAPRLPLDVDDGTIVGSARRRSRTGTWIAVFVVVGALGALAAVRFYLAASRESPAIQE